MAFSVGDAIFGALSMKSMSQALHSHSVYEEIVAHTNLSMMTKLTDYFGAKEKSEAFRKAWIGATEATLIERKERKLLLSDSE